MASGAVPAGPLQPGFPAESGVTRRCRSGCVTAGAVALGLMAQAATSPVLAQAPSLGTAATFGVLAGSAVTNTGPTVINGDVGVWAGNSITGFPPGSVTPPYGFHQTDAVAQQAQSDNVTAYNVLAGRPVSANLTGQDLGGRTLSAGVYGFNGSAALTGTLVLDGQGNPNAVFIFKIGSTLTTASASRILLINGAQGGNVFFQVGSSATLGTSTSFVGEILALTSITLNTSATINCGSALAQNGAVTLDSNVINICTTGVAAGQAPTVTPGSGLPPDATQNEMAVADAINAFIRNGGTLPPGFLDLLVFLTPSELAAVLTQLSGENGTGIAQAGTQAMNSFLSLVTNPFNDGRGFAPERPLPPRSPLYVKAPVYKASPLAAYDPRRWNIWASGFGGKNNANGDAFVGSHDRSVRSVGYAAGLDYRVTADTIVGFALAGGATHYGLSDALGGGRSDMFQAAVYGMTRFEAAYVSAAVAYAWHRVSTDRVLTLLNSDHLTADFSAYDVGGRIEGGYRFGIPGMYGLSGFGFTPYGAVQAQSFHTPGYSESATNLASLFALAYDARTTTTTRTELGAWFDKSMWFGDSAILSLRARAAWAHDHWSDPSINAMFVSLPGSSFTVFGADPARDSLLASGTAEIRFRNGIAVAGRFDSEFAANTTTYGGFGRVSYTW